MLTFQMIPQSSRLSDGGEGLKVGFWIWQRWQATRRLYLLLVVLWNGCSVFLDASLLGK